MQGLPDSSVYGKALQSSCYLTISSCSLFIPRLFGLFAACLRLLCLVYLILNAFDKCYLGGHPSSKEVPTQAKQKQACKWILHWPDRSMPTSIFSKKKVCTAHSGTCKLYQEWFMAAICAGAWGNGHQVSNTTTLSYQISASSFFFKHSTGCLKPLLVRFQRSEKVDW